MHRLVKPTIFIALIGLAPAAIAGGTTHIVEVLDFDFREMDLTIQPGDTVLWEWNGVFLHSATTAEDQIVFFDSGLQTEGEFAFTFEEVGTVNYYCTLHGNDLGGGEVSGMSGTIVVADAAEKPVMTFLDDDGCPGPSTFEMTGLTPGGQWAFLTGNRASPGDFPGGPCVGSEASVSDGLKLRTTGSADDRGNAAISPTLPDGACGIFAQVLDVATCLSSEAVLLCW